MRKLKPVLAIFVIPLSFLLMGCSTNSESRSSRALFKTRAEAEKAAKDFNCTGAHKMGDRWMPCKSHNLEKHSKDGGHHHH